MADGIGGEAAGTTIARRMREIRTRRGWSQDDLSARIREIGGRMSRPVLYRIEEGGTRAHRLSVEEFLVIAAALGVAPNYLLTDTTDRPGRSLSITSSIAMHPRAARAWMAGTGSPPGEESLRFYLSERPESDLEAIHAQWIEASASASALDPRAAPQEVVERAPPPPPDDRRKTTTRRRRTTKE